MPREHGDGTRAGHANVKGADQAVDAGGCDDGVAVFIPVVREGLGGGNADWGGSAHARFRGRVDGHVEREVVACARGCSEVEDAQVRV